MHASDEDTGKDKEIMLSMIIDECKVDDQLWMETGIDADDLKRAIERLNLATDPEFRDIAQSY